MSIKPDVYLMAGRFEEIKKNEDEYAVHSCLLTKNYVGFKDSVFVGLYAIPDTHRVVSVEFLQDLLTDAYLHPHDSAVALELCEIIDGK